MLQVLQNDHEVITDDEFNMLFESLVPSVSPTTRARLQSAFPELSAGSTMSHHFHISESGHQSGYDGLPLVLSNMQNCHIHIHIHR